MSDLSEDEDHNVESSARSARPTLAQVKAIIAFMEKHPKLAHKRLRVKGMTNERFNKLWEELSNILNLKINGPEKSSKGWIKFWSDKRRNIIMKQKQIQQGKLQSKLSPMSLKILELCGDKVYKNCKKRRNNAMKQEPCNGEDDDSYYDDKTFSGDMRCNGANHSRSNTDIEDRHLSMINKMVDAMDQQAAALTQMAQASLSNSKALERVAEASHIQALAVDRLAGTFETISTSVLDVRNAILGIDYTMKRCYPTTQRQNSNIFS